MSNYHMAKHLFLPPISYTSKRVSSYASIKSGNMILVRTIALFNQHNYFAVFLINYMSHNTRGVITCYFLAPFSSIPTVWHTVCANKSHSLKRPMHTTYVIGKINESNHCKKNTTRKRCSPPSHRAVFVQHYENCQTKASLKWWMFPRGHKLENFPWFPSYASVLSLIWRLVPGGILRMIIRGCSYIT